MKGNAHNLMKISAKRRRTKAQIEAEKKREEEEKEATRRALAEHDELKRQLNELRQQHVNQE